MLDYPSEVRRLEVNLEGIPLEYRVINVNGESIDAFNDIDHTGIILTEGKWTPCEAQFSISLSPHSINVLQVRTLS